MIKERKDFYEDQVIRAVDLLLSTYPPIDFGNTPMYLTPEERIELGKRIARQYVTAVDDFLKEHPGAKPRLGWRFWWQDEKSAPWCDDWACFIEERMTDLRREMIAIGGRDITIGRLVIFERGQHYISPGNQHNFVIMRPVNRKLRPPQNPGVPLPDRYYLIFDPWYTITPEVYHP
ncbi:MAG: hypothetical protein KatS3mg110_3320 [Pirellulaceae bacterium]|nr:MAG: hypothetical protein KatS3mg110_3320 [Pirellulaceae bacterium]